MKRSLLVLLVAVPFVGQPSPGWAAGGARKPAGKAADAAAKPAAPDPAEERRRTLRKKIMRDDDFVESENNRDPFRSFIGLFQDRAVQRPKTVPAIFEKFALEELNLIAVITGTDKPLAMFRDPAGLGQVIKRGDYLSKSAARVTKILPDRVILELTEVIATGESRPVEKAVLVNPEAAATQ